MFKHFAAEFTNKNYLREPGAVPYLRMKWVDKIKRMKGSQRKLNFHKNKRAFIETLNVIMRHDIKSAEADELFDFFVSKLKLPEYAFIIALWHGNEHALDYLLTKTKISNLEEKVSGYLDIWANPESVLRSFLCMTKYQIRFGDMVWCRLVAYNMIHVVRKLIRVAPGEISFSTLLPDEAFSLPPRTSVDLLRCLEDHGINVCNESSLEFFKKHGVEENVKYIEEMMAARKEELEELFESGLIDVPFDELDSEDVEEEYIERHKQLRCKYRKEMREYRLKNEINK